MNHSIIKDYYTLNEVCDFLSESLNQSFTAFDILFAVCERDIKLCFYHCGFIGVNEWDRVSGESVDKRIPFDGVLEIQQIGSIQRVLDTGEIFVSNVKPFFWVRHKVKQLKLNEEILKFNEPQIFMVNFDNHIANQSIRIEKLIIPSCTLVDLLQIFKKRNSTNFFENAAKPTSERERETLLVIIAALAKEAKVDIKKISKASDLIANMTQLIGAPIGATTIERHLKIINQAILNRTK